MRYLLFLGVLTAVHLNAVQVNGRTMSITIAPSQVSGGNASVIIWGSEPYTDGPFAGVGAQDPTTAANIKGLTFVIHAWREGDKTRVVVYAMLDD